MTHKLRVPTPEPFSFIEFEFSGTPEEAMDEYRRLTGAVKEDTGISTADFNAVLDDLLEDGSIKGDPAIVAELMSSAQRFVINEVKKSYKRIK